jgi:hypothetical protein
MADLAPTVGALARALGLPDRALDVAADTWNKLLDSKSFEVADGMLADVLYKKQCIRRIRFVAEIREALDKSGVPPSALPEGFALQAIEGGSYADDEDVRALWRHLVVNAVRHPDHARPLYVEILKRMSADDVLVLRRVANAPAPMPDEHGKVKMRFIGPGSEPGLREALVRLLALNLIDPPWSGYGRLRSPITLYAEISALEELLLEATNNESEDVPRATAVEPTAADRKAATQ